MLAAAILIRMWQIRQFQINFLHLVPDQINARGEARSGPAVSHDPSLSGSSLQKCFLALRIGWYFTALMTQKGF